MVQFLSSSATTTITVLTAEVGTSLDIFAPDQVVQGVPFIVAGTLRRIDTEQVLAGEEIIVSVNGLELGRDITRISGDYLVDAILPNTGTFTLTAEFLGAERPGLTLGASSASKSIGTLAEPSVLPLVVLAGIVAYAALKK